MNLRQAQSAAPHYAANFKNIVLFVNQCFFIMDAITVTAYNVFFFPLPDLIITHYGFVQATSSQLTSTASWESLRFACLHFTCNLLASPVLPSDTQRRIWANIAHTYTPNVDAPPKQK